MHAYLIVGKNNFEIDKKLDELIKKLNVEKIPQNLKTIAEVRSLSSILKIEYEKPLAIVSKNIDESSVEAMNSFLKSLEEPRKNIYFILTASNLNKVLPTIKSRAQIIFTTGSIDIDKPTLELAEEFIVSAKQQQIMILDKIKKRDEAKIFLTAIQKVIKEKILDTNFDKLNLAKIAYQSNKAINNLDKNANVNLTLLTFLVNL